MTRGFLMGAALATGALVLLPGVAVALGRAGKPLVRATVKTGTVAYDEFRKAGAEAYEHMEDIVAEVREEMQADADAEAYTDDADAPAPEPDPGDER